jgi:hypothetical protein
LCATNDKWRIPNETKRSIENNFNEMIFCSNFYLPLWKRNWIRCSREKIETSLHFSKMATIKQCKVRNPKRTCVSICNSTRTPINKSKRGKQFQDFPNFNALIKSEFFKLTNLTMKQVFKTDKTRRNWHRPGLAWFDTNQNRFKIRCRNRKLESCFSRNQ